MIKETTFRLEIDLSAVGKIGLGLVTLSPCRTSQNVIQTQKCVLCCEYAKPNRCVFESFAQVSELKNEGLKPTGKTFQLLGPATAKDLKPQSIRWQGATMSPWAADLKADRPGTKEVLLQLFSEISRGRTSQALNHNRTTCICSW